MSNKNKVTSDDFLDLLNSSEPEEEGSFTLQRPKDRNRDLSSPIAQPLVNRNKTVDKQVANYKQSGSKVVAQPAANYKQSGSKVVAQPAANYKQSGSKVVAKSKVGVSKKQESISKVVAQPVAQPVANYKQSGSKVVAKCSFQELTGLQKKLTEMIYQSCRRRGEKISSPITIEYFSKILETSSGTLKNAILRLQKKNVLSKHSYKNGRGGWTQYQINDVIYQDLLQHESDSKVVANYKQSDSKVVAQPVAQPVASTPSSSSSVLINKDSTITKNNYVTKWLESLDLTSFSDSGVTTSTIARCLELYSNLEPEQLDDLIYRFGEHLKTPEGKSIKNPRGFFISLSRQLSEGITPLDNIETQADKYMREYVRKKEEKEAQRKELEQKALDFEFISWLEGLGTEEETSLCLPIV